MKSASGAVSKHGILPRSAIMSLRSFRRLTARPGSESSSLTTITSNVLVVERVPRELVADSESLYSPEVSNTNEGLDSVVAATSSPSKVRLHA